MKFFQKLTFRLFLIEEMDTYSARLNRIGPGIWSRAYIRKCRALRCVTLPHSPIFSCYNRASRQAARVHKKQPNHATVS